MKTLKILALSCVGLAGLQSTQATMLGDPIEVTPVNSPEQQALFDSLSEGLGETPGPEDGHIIVSNAKQCVIALHPDKPEGPYDDNVINFVGNVGRSILESRKNIQSGNN